EVGQHCLGISQEIYLGWDRSPGMAEAIDTPNVWSNYRLDLAPKTWKLIKGLRRVTAVFTMPSDPIKCAGAPQKIAYLAADYWRQQGGRDAIRIILVLPTPAMVGVAAISNQVHKAA